MTYERNQNRTKWYCTTFDADGHPRGHFDTDKENAGYMTHAEAREWAEEKLAEDDMACAAEYYNHHHDHDFAYA